MDSDRSLEKMNRRKSLKKNWGGISVYCTDSDDIQCKGPEMSGFRHRRRFFNASGI